MTEDDQRDLRARPRAEEASGEAAPADAVPRSAIVGALLGVTVFAYLIAFPPVLHPVDESLFLYGAKRIANGQALYRDFFEFITPAGFYLFALVFTVAGATLQAARAAMMTVHAISAVLMYVLARKVAGVLEALLAALAFAVICVPVWYQMSPHWLSTSLCLATAAVLLSDRWQAAEHGRLIATGALAGLSFATQQQRGVFLGAWVVVALAVLTWRGPAGRFGRWVRAVLWTGVGWVPVVLVILGYAVWRSSLHELVDSVFTHVFGAYAQANMGKIGWGGVGWITKANAARTWPWIPRLVPTVLVLESLTLLWRAFGARWGRQERVATCLVLLGTAMAGAIFYFPDIIHISFILPFTLVVAASLVHRVRSLGDTSRVGGLWRAITYVALALAFVVLADKARRNLQLMRDWTPLRLQTAFGTVAVSDETRKTVEEVPAAVPTGPDGRRTFFVYPGYPILYLTTPADNPTPFSLMRANTEQQFETALAALDRNPGAYVIVNVLFSKREGDPLGKFLEGRYVKEATVGYWKLFWVYRRVDVDGG